MENIKFIILFYILIAMIGCSSFKKSKPNISEEKLPNTCNGITNLIKKNWKKHKELDFYYKDKDFLKKIVTEYKDCFIKLSVEQGIKLLGNTPVKTDPIRVWGKDSFLYFLDPECIEHPLYDCEMLSFRIKDGLIKDVAVGEFDLIFDK